MTPTDEEAMRTVANAAVEIVQDCREALGLEKGVLLTEAVTRLADDRERLIAENAEQARQLGIAAQDRREWHTMNAELRAALDRVERERDEARQAASFFKSGMLCGEDWTPRCDEMAAKISGPHPTPESKP